MVFLTNTVPEVNVMDNKYSEIKCMKWSGIENIFLG